MKNILDLCKALEIPQEYIMPFGWDKAKIDLRFKEQLKDKKDGKWVIVSAIEPGKFGIGKSTVSIGIQDGLRALGINSMLCLRQNSLGPVFGVKGNAIGNGKASLVPEKAISLHVNGDFHALTSAINLVSAVIENHIYQGNELNIDPNKIIWKRAIDMNDRSLRSVTVAQDDKKAIPHKMEYVITVAHELMSVWTVATSREDFQDRINKMLIAYTYDNKPVYLRDLKMSNSIMLLMEDVLSPNIVQTSEGNPCLLSAGAFCNISCGTNSFIATQMALKLSDIVIQEFGFGGSLGLEKALNLVAPMGGFKPAAAILVTTVNGLKAHGGQQEAEINAVNLETLSKGTANLEKHIETCQNQGVPFVIAINKFAHDNQVELDWLITWCKEHNYAYAISTAVADGSAGATDLAKVLLNTIETSENNYKQLYDFKENAYDKFEKICKQIYGAKDIIYSDKAKQDMDTYIALGYNDFGICTAKTPLSISDNPKLLNRPTDFTIHVDEVRIACGAGFLIPMCGGVLMLPGLNKNCKALDEFAQLKL